MADISEAMVEAACEAYWNAATIITAPWASQPAEQKHLVRVRMRAAIEAVAALSAAPASAQMEGMVPVPKVALDWLFGQGPGPDGLWFGDFPNDIKPRGAFWWRSYFRRTITAAPLPTSEGSSNG